jgi:hypothetical protein
MKWFEPPDFKKLGMVSAMQWEKLQWNLLDHTAVMTPRERSLFAKLQIAEIIVTSAYNNNNKISSEIRIYVDIFTKPKHPDFNKQGECIYYDAMISCFLVIAGYPPETYIKRRRKSSDLQPFQSSYEMLLDDKISNLDVTENIIRGWIDELDVPSIECIHYHGLISEMPITYLVACSRAGVIDGLPLTKQAMRKFIRSPAFKKFGAVKFDQLKLFDLICSLETDAYLHHLKSEVYKKRYPHRLNDFLRGFKDISIFS